jgi:signal transduction histidine kinase
MPLSIRTKQIAGVTALVGLVAVLLSLWYLSSIARVQLRETQARAEFISKAIYERLFGFVAEGNDPAAIQRDPGLQSIMNASNYGANVISAAVVDATGRVLAHWDDSLVGQTLPPAPDLRVLAEASPVAQALAVTDTERVRYELTDPILVGDRQWSIRIGVSTLLIRENLYREMRTPLYTALAAIGIATFLAVLLARAVVRPIHVIRSGLARLGRGELDVQVDLPRNEELAEVGDSLKAISARLAEERSQLAGQRATLQSVGEHLEDAVALFSPAGELLFVNPPMRGMIPDASGSIEDLLPAGHPYRVAVEDALAGRETSPPRTVDVPGAGQRLVLTDLVRDASHQTLGVLLISRNLAYLSEVESSLSYSRKLAALSRLTAGIAHEVKNPLNATMIHLELLRMQVAGQEQALEHVSVIAAQMRRLDEVVQGFLRFTRPEDLQLRPVSIAGMFDAILPVVRAEAGKHNVTVTVDVPPDLPRVSGDQSMLEQAFLNLALNACQAMPEGGQLRLAAAPAKQRQVEVRVEDTGVGIPPANLARIFDLYFTTKTHGSGIGLSLVYRTVQIHDGEIAVESTPGRGTTFRVLLRQATSEAARRLLPAS